MSTKWTSSHSESGILRKTEFKEKKEELFVFGYSCKLFREDDRALHIDQGKHLIPWMGDESLKIDRYDARGALHELSSHEAPPGGYDWRVELTKTEQDVEQLCDEERYRALHTDEDEEEMYKEEELKRLHAAGYGQVGFNYDAPKEPEPVSQPAEADEPFLPTTTLRALLPPDMVLPESDKQNVIIEKTAKFIASQGAQMEILIKAKQGDNPQFQFLNKDSILNPYYTALIGLIKAGKWPEKKIEVVEEKVPENEEYLHPSLASTVIELAPSIPSIHYKPSADCDYTLLISKMRGDPPPEEPYTAELAPGEVAPPGTEPLPPRVNAEITRAPVMYNRGENHDDPVNQAAQAHAAAVYQQQYAAYYHQYMAQAAAIQQSEQQQALQKEPPKPGPLKSTGLSLMKNYNTDSDSDVSDCDDASSTDSKDKPIIITPPEDVQVVIEKMAAYVARNGAEFAEIVRAKGDPRFSFLEPSDVHHAFYNARLVKLQIGDDKKPKRAAAPVSFSIKKLKEPDPILPKPALPYESSSDEEGEKEKEKIEEAPKVPPPIFPTNSIPPVIVYKMEATQVNNSTTVKAIETVTSVPKPIPMVTTVLEVTKEEPKPVIVQENPVPKIEASAEKNKSPTPDIKVKEPEREKPESPKKEKLKEKKRDRSKSRERRSRSREKRSRSRDRRSNSKDKESKRDRRKSVERGRKKDKDDEKTKKKKEVKEEESEIISLEDNSDNDMIDLTGDQSDTKEGDTEVDRSKQQERRRRAAEFLKKVGVDPATATALPTSSLASAMVDTLESIRKKKAQEEEKRRKREKRKRRERHGHSVEDRSHRKSKRRKYRSSGDEDEDYDSSKKRKRKKDRKSSKNKKKKRQEPEKEEEMDHPLPPNIDLTTTLKELRTSSPTKELCLQAVEDVKELSEEELAKKKKEDREYSEGEWSSDSADDSCSTPSEKEN